MNRKHAPIETIEDNMLLVCDLFRESGDEAFKEFISDDIYYTLAHYGINALTEVLAYVIQHVKDYDSK